MLKDLELKNVYTSNQDNLLLDFYLPVLSQAVSYDRLTGYFNPMTLSIAAKGMARLIKNDGNIRIITSVQVDPDIIRASREDPRKFKFNFDLNNFSLDKLETELQKNYYRLFLALLSENKIKIKIAALPTRDGIFHEKIGILKDKYGNGISFSGSNNETVGGWLKNSEEFKVFPNWKHETKNFFLADADKFQKYWHNKDKNVFVIDLPEAVEKKLLTAQNELYKKTDLISEIEKLELLENKSTSSEIELRDYQIDAITHWFKNKNVGIFEMATGTGKTFTAIGAMDRYKKQIQNLRAVIGVPSRTLVDQWSNDLISFFGDVEIIKIYSGQNWRARMNDKLFAAKINKNVEFILLGTYVSLSSEVFINEVVNYGVKDIVFVADEMHNLTSNKRIAAIQLEEYKYKLGLSATPTRLWRKEESKQVYKVFGSNKYEYGIEKAIANKFLVPFNYNVIPVNLTEDEYLEYETLTKKLRFKKNSSDEGKYTESILRKRARIKKNAEDKFVKLPTIIQKINNELGFYYVLLYTDDTKSLSLVQEVLHKNNFLNSKYTGKESDKVRRTIINSFKEKNIRAIVAIKCLDEGVDIPVAQKAVFLSNNTDPREYIQRLGRVLRLSPDKTIAHIYDFVVLPPISRDFNDKIARNLIVAELKRFHYFTQLAYNKLEAEVVMGQLMDQYGIYLKREELSDAQ